MQNRLLTFVSLFATAALVPGPAFSQTATTQFNVQVTIEAECLINSAGDMSFGTAGVLDTDVEATSEIAVQCTSGTPYDIGLGVGPGASVAARLMTGPGDETVTYALYSDPARTDLWGNTIGTDTATGTGTGTEQTYTVYGQGPPQDAPAPGTYTDIVTVTVTY